MALQALSAILALLGTAIFYLWHINRVIKRSYPEATVLSPHRWTEAEIRSREKQIALKPLDTVPHLPPATGRRYIIIGGSGFVGGWVIRHLIARGENPYNIRNIDVREPIRQDLLEGEATKVPLIKADVTNVKSLRAAFTAPWPAQATFHSSGITVVHTVASIRYYERHPSLLSRSMGINVDGTQNALTLARENGVDVFLFVSSASIPVSPVRFWIWPWERMPRNFVQVKGDEPSNGKLKEHHEFFSNYGYTKYLAEELVTKADDPDRGFKTGTLRPGSALYGCGGDLVTNRYIADEVNPTWIGPMIQSVTYVENVSYGLLLYESRLLQKPSPSAPRLSGQSYLICDTGDPIAYDDLYFALNVLTNGRVTFPDIPASLMLVLAHLIEAYCLVQANLTWLPPITGDILNVQPPMFSLTSVHYKVDDSRARRSPAEGGLGYNAPWTTLDGVCQVVKEDSEAKGRKAAGIPASNGHTVKEIGQTLNPAKAAASVADGHR